MSSLLQRVRALAARLEPVNDSAEPWDVSDTSEWTTHATDVAFTILLDLTPDAGPRLDHDERAEETSRLVARTYLELNGGGRFHDAAALQPLVDRLHRLSAVAAACPSECACAPPPPPLTLTEHHALLSLLLQLAASSWGGDDCSAQPQGSGLSRDGRAGAHGYQRHAARLPVGYAPAVAPSLPPGALLTTSGAPPLGAGSGGTASPLLLGSGVGAGPPGSGGGGLGGGDDGWGSWMPFRDDAGVPRDPFGGGGGSGGVMGEHMHIHRGGGGGGTGRSVTEWFPRVPALLRAPPALPPTPTIATVAANTAPAPAPLPLPWAAPTGGQRHAGGTGASSRHRGMRDGSARLAGIGEEAPVLDDSADARGVAPFGSFSAFGGAVISSTVGGGVAVVAAGAALPATGSSAGGGVGAGGLAEWMPVGAGAALLGGGAGDGGDDDWGAATWLRGSVGGGGGDSDGSGAATEGPGSVGAAPSPALSLSLALLPPTAAATAARPRAPQGPAAAAAPPTKAVPDEGRCVELALMALRGVAAAYRELASLVAEAAVRPQHQLPHLSQHQSQHQQQLRGAARALVQRLLAPARLRLRLDAFLAHHRSGAALAVTAAAGPRDARGARRGGDPMVRAFAACLEQQLGQQTAALTCLAHRIADSKVGGGAPPTLLDVWLTTGRVRAQLAQLCVLCRCTPATGATAAGGGGASSACCRGACDGVAGPSPRCWELSEQLRSLGVGAGEWEVCADGFPRGSALLDTLHARLLVAAGPAAPLLRLLLLRCLAPLAASRLDRVGARWAAARCDALRWTLDALAARRAAAAATDSLRAAAAAAARGAAEAEGARLSAAHAAAVARQRAGLLAEQRAAADGAVARRAMERATDMEDDRVRALDHQLAEQNALLAHLTRQLGIAGPAGGAGGAAVAAESGRRAEAGGAAGGGRRAGGSTSGGAEQGGEEEGEGGEDDSPLAGTPFSRAAAARGDESGSGDGSGRGDGDEGDGDEEIGTGMDIDGDEYLPDDGGDESVSMMDTGSGPGSAQSSPLAPLPLGAGGGGRGGGAGGGGAGGGGGGGGWQGSGGVERGGCGGGGGEGGGRGRWGRRTPPSAGRPSGRDDPPFILGGEGCEGGGGGGGDGAVAGLVTPARARGGAPDAPGSSRGGARDARAAHGPLPPSSPTAATPGTAARARRRRWQSPGRERHGGGGGSPGPTRDRHDRSSVGSGSMAAAPVSTLVDVCIGASVRSQYWLTTRALWSVALHELRLLECLATLRRFFFGEAGDFAQLLADRLLAVLAAQAQAQASVDAAAPPAPAAAGSPPTLPSSAGAAPCTSVGAGVGAGAGAGAGTGDARLPGMQALGMVLEDAKAACSCVGEAASAELYFSSTPGRDVYNNGRVGGGGEQLARLRALVSATDAATLCCRLSDPDVAHLLDLHPGSPAAASYAAVFSALLRLRCCVARLHASWLGLSKPTMVEAAARAAEEEGASADIDGASARAARRVRSMRLWHRQALHFSCKLQQHVAGELLGPVWTQLEEGLCDRPVDLGQMRALHSAYLSRATAVCLLPPAGSSGGSGGSGGSSGSDSGAGGIGPGRGVGGGTLNRSGGGGGGQRSESTRAALAAALHACEVFAAASVCEPQLQTAPPPPPADGAVVAAAGVAAAGFAPKPQLLSWYGQLKTCASGVDAAVRAAVRALEADSGPGAAGLRATLGCAFYSEA
ncbi:hypothetical protein FOA52_014231 [Chlamydomonas sp. UWO 241]|nr:hypothetical protein FOA52_014231 [Chlamydomonas sp. UWO 241]